VEAHRANIMEKLNANTVADLLKIALGHAAEDLKTGLPDAEDAKSTQRTRKNIL